MKYTQFRWLLFTMAIALMGLVGLQVYWLKGAADAERSQFDETVRKAMADATIQLESGEAYTMITERLFPALPGDSVFITDSVPFPNSPNKIRIIQKYSDTDDTITENIIEVPEIPSSPRPPSPPTPPAAPSPQEMARIDSLFAVQNSKEFSVTVHRVERLKSAVKGVWREFVEQSGSTGDRIKQDEIGNVLTASFRNAGITDTFSFGVYSGTEKKLSYASDSIAKAKLLQSPYRVALFPSDIHPEGDELLVSMDTGNGRFLFAIWQQLLLAFLLTSVLIFVFWITYREALRQKKISEIRNDFINNMTHEFKTPIATISLATDTVVNPAIINDPEKIRHYADLIRRENKRMNDQVEKVLELALAERNELQLVKEPIDPDEILEKAVASMSLQATAKNAKIILENTDPLPVFNADPFHLERAFTNLLDNAIKYSPSGGDIIVRTSRKENEFSISFTDHGMGISEEEQKRIFDRFYRVSTGNRHDVKGFGLGLSYVKTIVEKHGGKISLSSKTGAGSIFTLSFPL